MEEVQALIPKLPDVIALDYIVRVPLPPRLRLNYQHWHDLVTTRSFHYHHERICSAEHLIFIIQVLGDTVVSIATNAIDLYLSVYTFSIYIARRFMQRANLAIIHLGYNNIKPLSHYVGSAT
ncbi:hypothetical protein MA16_Dca000447 [Dendrobium catenatum]|uniref:Uncharacterized protein n=1 Tax=Dendrobium catenatum TaxID=906689 RepID=A0A2I0WTY8_9ASPA|nr:hypothetical protein MA16_Dca000447 [Dendrobium catenatum]